MSTLAYASLTARREAAPPQKSKSESPPGVGSYVDAMAALVPAEVLSLHAMILSVTTSTQQGVIKIEDAQTLSWAFLGLIVLSVVLYVAPRFKKWDRLDYIRVIIPPLAFLAWTMLQRATAFDAVSQLAPEPRTVIALFLAVLLGLTAAGLANKADKQPPPSPQS